MTSVISAGSASVGTAATPDIATTSLAQKPFVRWVILLLPAAVVLGPIASYPMYSGGLFSAYRVLYLPAAIAFFIIWRRHGKPNFIGSRALLVLTGLIALFGTAATLFADITSRGATDHFILVSSLLVAWFVAAAVSCDWDTRNTLLTAWFWAYMLAALMAVLHASGLFVPQTFTNILIEAYAATGRQIGFAGTLGNPNDLAAFALAGGPIAYLAARRWERPWMTWLIIAAALTMGLVSLSRSVLIGLLVLPLVFVAFRRSPDPGRLPVLAVVGGYLVLLLVAFSASGLARHLSGVPFLGAIIDEVESGVINADSARVATWRDLWKASFQEPWGAGPGQYEVVAEESGFAIVVNAHNVFLEILFEYGVIVGMAGLVWIVIVVAKSWQAAKFATSENDNIVVAAAAASLVGLIVWGLLTSTLITRPPWALLLGTAIGLISSVALSTRQSEGELNS